VRATRRGTIGETTNASVITSILRSASTAVSSAPKERHGKRYGCQVSAPYTWTPNGVPCFRVGQAPPFLWTESQLRAVDLRPGAGPCAAFVESQYGPAALYLITDAILADPGRWPPARPEQPDVIASDGPTNS
jgi:hypothetical protein